MSLQDQNFSVSIREQSGMFILYIADLGLFAEAQDMASAYQSLMQKKNEYFAKVEKLGLTPELEKKLRAPTEREGFPKKAFLGFLGALLLIVFVVLGSASRNINKLSGKLTEALSAPPEKQKEYLQRYHHFLLQVKPYWDETKNTLGNQP